jgi:hypothetical protein
MDIIERIAEARIQEAIERGELNGLPGEGKPLALEDDRMIPAELRVAYRVLKNAGLLPPELELRREIRRVEELIHMAVDADARRRARLKLDLLRAQLAQRRGHEPLYDDPAYRERVLDRLDRG